MNATFTDDWTSIHHGDCLEVMRGMDADSIDAIVTDPPYGLSFMGREWDHGVPGEAFWAEALRVAKPGAHLVAFGGTRTYHRLAVAIEDAGWEVRDCLGWLYGSGFPKSLDVSKAIDKGYGENRARQLEFTAWMRSTGVTAAQINAATDSFMGSHYLTDKEQAAIATADMFDRLRHLLPDVPEHIERLVAERTGIEWTAYVNRPITQEAKRASVAGEVISFDQRGSTERERRDIPSTEAAQRWQGWGTALKPAWEPCILARKPLTSTVAANVQRWGTGALNIDGCRVAYASDDDMAAAAAEIRSKQTARNFEGWGMRDQQLTSDEYLRGGAGLGRWPANIVHDGSDEVLAVLGDQARFFYTSKASSAEREGYLTCDCETVKLDAWVKEVHSHNEPTVCTSPQRDTSVATSEDVCGSSTSPCGSSTTAPSRPDLTFTTPTATSKTTESRTCDSSASSNTSGSTAAASCATASGTSHAGSVDQCSPSTPSTGISPQRAGRSTGVVVPVTSPLWSGTRRCAVCGSAVRKAAHPTQKPLDLMRWLVRLVTPPDGVVLDPFMGSGTTLKAARAEGHRSIGIDLERDHCEIAWGRLSQGVLL